MTQVSLTDTTIWFETDLTCKPLKNLKEVELFLFDPPAWRTLCQPITRHSTSAIKNSEVNENFDCITSEKPQSFCHFDPDRPSVARYDEKILPKLLVCHDMANGYHDDSMIDGTSNHEAYTFYNWAAVDIFCYFSHHLITIPPLSWINVAHAHGVKVIGTLITEWADGVRFWKEIMESRTKMEQLVSSLVTIAKTLKFEGWLINIENKMSEPVMLLEFVKLLHKTLHQEIPDAELIWYDSVTKDGHLIWQNALNIHNRPFFDACDGIFTNYSWSINDIRLSAEEAGSRLRDLYIGVDVWGRNFFGGGKFNTQEAVKVAHQHGCSVAIFAPAWTHEAMGEENDEENPQQIIMGGELERHERFMLRDEAFWDSLWPYFKTRLPCTLPFKTSFCLGLGIKRRLYGEVFSNSPWFNLRHMQYQPNSRLGDHKYLLSTKIKIHRASRAVIKNDRGILKLRQSFAQMVAHDENNEKETEIKIQDNTINEIAFSKGDKEIDPEMNNKNLLNTKSKQQSDEEHNHKTEEPKTPKRGNFFVRLFSSKRKSDTSSVNTSEDHPQTSSHETNELTSDSSNLTQRGTSTARSPVKLNLGCERHELTLAYVHEEKRCLEVFYGDSFNGGTCLCVTCSDQVVEGHRTIRLFHCDFMITDKLVVCMVTKNLKGFSSQLLDMWLYVLAKGGEEQRVRLLGRRTELGGTDGADAVDGNDGAHDRFYPLNHTSDEFRDLQTYLVVNEPGFYVPIENSFGWHVYYYEVQLGEACVTSINLRTSDCYGSILLGHVGFCGHLVAIQNEVYETTT